MPAQFSIAGLHENAFILLQLTQHRSSLRPKRSRARLEKSKKCSNRGQTLRSSEPLGIRKILRPVRIPCPTLQQECHRILIRREEIQQRLYTQCRRQALKDLFIARQRVSMHIDIKARIVTFNYDV